MTPISGFIAPIRRPGALGVHALDHFCLAAPDLEAADHKPEDAFKPGGPEPPADFVTNVEA
jgi:hypothetical protein